MKADDSFGVRAFTRSAPFGVAIRGSDDRCLTKGIDLEREPARVDSKRIGSRPAVELRFGPRAVFFGRCGHFSVTLVD